MNRRALITGITGQDGSYLAEFLLEQGYEVFGLVRRVSNPNDDRITHLRGQVTLLPGDLLDEASLVRALQVARPRELYNLAAQSFVQTSFAEPTFTSDVTALGVTRPAEVDLLLGDASRAREKLGWTPRVTFPELVRMMVQADLERLKR